MEMENKDPTTQPVSLPLGFLRFITDDFCHERELGKGASGVVYKGILPCGSVIAVKKFDERILMGDDQSFKDEVSFLMDIEHQNIVQLLGYCAESSGVLMKQPNRKGIVLEQLTRIICFEYMWNGCLDEHLSDESSGLEWNMRYKIIKGICSGLEYLHERNIIHRDLKPQNILMDITMVPKIADFGLSRLLDENKLYAVTSNLAGTLGYMAPEYINKLEISKEADIFSLGVIIIEILLGCKDGYPNYNLDTKTDFQHFTERVLSNWGKRFERSSKYTSPELHTRLVKQCIDIALGCVHPNREKRPNISKIIEILNAEEKSCYDQNGDGVPVDHQMPTHEGLLISGVLQEDSFVGLNKIALKNHAQAWITKGMKSAVAPHQPQREPALAGYQVARSASFWVAHNALACLETDLLKDWAATNNITPNINSLELELISVKAILESTQGRVIHNSTLERSLMMLQDLVYDAEDVVDEMEYFRIQDTLDASQHVGALNLDLNVLPSVSDEPPKMIYDRVHASNRINHIVEKMQQVQQRISSIMTHLGSNWSMVPNISQIRPISTSESIEPKLYGREYMIKSIIDDITKGKHSCEVLTVIPVVGLGGIGKTTLAQHIYHSGEVQEHFDVRIWICVSLNFNVNKLTEEIQRCIPKVDHESSNANASELIGQRLKNKRTLLVLDDIWDCTDEDEWKRLLVPFQKSQVLGNIIIVTTRFPAQAHIMVQNNDHSIYLQGLDSESFQELFLEIIFGDDDQSRKEHNFLLEIGIIIAGRLKGSPLAAKTVGRLLKTQLDLDHWTRVLESKEWEHSHGKNDVMPALKLSFDYLPYQLQQCFSYFSLFPQDYKFERQEIISFWIGQEVLHSSHGENKKVEDIGLSCLTALVNYGFLLENKGGKDEKTCYIIHDLLHELAQKVSSRECLSIDNSQSQVSSLRVLPSIRHLSINIDDTSIKDRFTLKSCIEDFNTLGTRLKVEKLRTLMIFGEHHGLFVKAFCDLFRGAKALRLVFLSGASYDVKDLLSNFHYLIHLRYLRIEGSRRYAARFPDRISRFFHMKVLDAKLCNISDDLPPRDFNNLLKLRYLHVGDDTIHSSIIEVGKLKSLQELRRFVVKQDDQGFELRQIGHLKELHGSLRIDNLENIQVPGEADEAKLMLKSHLHGLILCWNNNWFTDDSALEKQVLERLKPSCNLQNLSIIRHRGDTCPSWLGWNLSLSSLKSLCLDDVNWKTFPPIGDLCLVNSPRKKTSINIPEKRFGNLRRLELIKLSGLKTWTVHASHQLFPYLEVLIIRDCPQLVELSFSNSFGCYQQGKDTNDNLFSNLKKLEIESCPQLSSFPPVPWTEALCYIKILGTSSVDYLLYVEGTQGTSSLNYSSCGKKDTIDSTYRNVLAFHNLTGLKQLEMSWCRFPPLCYLQMLPSLRTIEISYPSNVSPFFEADCHVKYQLPVESLIIDECSASGKELTQLLVYFPKLSDLQLTSCMKVKWLGVNVRGQHATGTPGPSSLANEVEQQQGARAEDDIIVTPEETERGLLLLPPQLQELLIYDCPELSLLCSSPNDNSNEEDGRSGGGGGIRGTSLRRLEIYNCPKLLSADLLLLAPQLQELEIRVCPKLRLLCSNPHDDSNEEDGLQGLTSLRQLVIKYCPELLSSYSSFLFPNSLEHLKIKGVVGMDTPVPISNLTSLTSLNISNCEDLTVEGLLSLLAQGHLTKLSVLGMPDFFVKSEPQWRHEQELTSCSSELQELYIDDVAGFTAAPIRRGLILSTLTKLVIVDDNNLERFTEEQEALLFVNSLEHITFDGCRNLQYLPKRLHELRSLKRLWIWGCGTIQMLPKDILPSSLEELKISDCPKIQSLHKNCLPDSLQKLEIRNCPAIRSLPEVDDLPTSLREIDVSYRGSEELRMQCRKFINIIPIVRA